MSNVQRENALQKECHALMVEHADPHVLFHSIPNEQKCKPGRGKALNEMGRTAGCADYIIVTPHNTLYIEFKCPKDLRGPKTYQSPQQKEFEAWCKKARAQYAVVRTVEEFLEAVWGVAQLTHISVTAGGAIKNDGDPFGTGGRA